MKCFLRFGISALFVSFGVQHVCSKGITQEFYRSSRICGVNSLYLGLKTINCQTEYSALREQFPSADDTGVSLSQLSDFLLKESIHHNIGFYEPKAIACSSLETAYFVLLKDGTDYHIILARPSADGKIQLLDRDAPIPVRKIEPKIWGEKIFALGISTNPFPTENFLGWLTPLLGVPLLLLFAFIAWRFTNRKKEPK
jgi:hypothetical protein